MTVFKLLGHYICVDHFVPVFFNGDSFDVIGPKLSRQNEFWPILLEKAFIKLFYSNICPIDIWWFNSKRRFSQNIHNYGPNYSDINGGFPRWALSILLNAAL